MWNFTLGSILSIWSILRLVFLGIGIETQGFDIDVSVVFGREDLSSLRSGGTAVTTIPVTVSSIVDSLTYTVCNVRLQKQKQVNTNEIQNKIP